MRTLWVLGWWNLTRNRTRDLDEIVFNKKFSSARVQEECAFSMMKNRWRILQKRFDSNIEFTIKAALACAALHSIFCEITMHKHDDEDEDDHSLPGNKPPNALLFRLNSLLSIILNFILIGYQYQYLGDKLTFAYYKTDCNYQENFSTLRIKKIRIIALMINVSLLFLLNFD